MNATMDRVRMFGPRAKVTRGLSVKTAPRFADGSLDWIFIDAGHRYEQVLSDLEVWYPKVRWGGFVTGDDYVDSKDTGLLKTERYVDWMRKTSEPSYNPGDWGVIRAVQEFASYKQHQLHITWLNDCKPPAWYFVKA